MSEGSATTAAPRPLSPARLAALWRQPLYRSGHALVINSVLTSGVGVLYWVAAARLYPVAIVGKSSAAISAMMFLATAAQLNLKSALVRFVPVAGERAPRLVWGCYLLGGLLTGLATYAFLAGLRWWAPKLAFLAVHPLIAAWFVASAALWALFVMQESALTGVGRAVVVPLENLVFSVAKIALLVAFASLLPLYGILASWTVAMAAVAAGANLYLFARAAPSFVRLSAGRREAVPLRQLAHFVTWDHAGSLLWHAVTWLLPLVILGLVGARETAVFTLAWNITYALYLVPSAMGQALVAHTAADRPRLAHNQRAVLVQTMALLVPAVAIVVLAAPYLLQMFGPTYSEEGTAVMRLLALSALPGMITALTVSEARVRRRMRVVVAVFGCLSSLVFGLSVLLLPLVGITGVGVAWLAGQSLVAAAILLLRHGHGGWVRAATLPRALLPVAARLLAGPRSWRHRLVARRVLGCLPGEETRGLTVPGARVLSVLPSASDTAAVALGVRGQPVAYLKLATSSNSAVGLRRQAAVLDALHRDERLGDWRRLLPRVLASGTVAGSTYLVESGLPADTARAPNRDPLLRPQLTAAAAVVIAGLHRETATTLRLDDHALARWIDEPIGLVHRALPPTRTAVGLHAAADRLAAGLRRELDGRRVAASWTHGDYCPDNILVSAGSRVEGREVVGVVDWGQAEPEGLPALDVASLLLTSEAGASRIELGELVRARLAGHAWNAGEERLLLPAQENLPGEPLSSRAVLLLGWLHHVANNLAKSRRYATNPVWMRRNVGAVLQVVADD